MSTIENDVAVCIQRLRELNVDVYKARQPILTRAARPLAKAGQAAAPKSAKPHKRYLTRKLTKGIRAPKGSGNVVATYFPGNLSRSMQTMRFPRAKSKVFVGARRSRRSNGVFAGRIVDGWYLNIVEQRQPFWVSTVIGMQEQTVQNIVQEFKNEVLKYERKA